MDAFTQAVAGQLRAELARKGIRRKELAEAWRVTRPTATARIQGRVPMTMSELEVAARLVGTDPWALVEAARPRLAPAA